MSRQLEKNEMSFIQKQQQLQKQSQSRLNTGISSQNKYAPRKQSPLGRDAGNVESLPQFLSAPPPEPMVLPAEIASIPAERQLFRQVQLQHLLKQQEEERRKQQSQATAPTTEKPQEPKPIEKPAPVTPPPPIRAPPPTLQQPKPQLAQLPQPPQQRPQQHYEQEPNVLHKDPPRPKSGDRKKAGGSWTNKLKNIFGLAKDEAEDVPSSAPMIISMPSITHQPNASMSDITMPQLNMHLRNASVPNISTQTLHIPSSPDYHIRNHSLSNPNVRVPKLAMPSVKNLKLENSLPRIPKEELHELESPVESVSPLSQARDEAIHQMPYRQREQSQERNQRQILPQRPVQGSFQLPADQGELLLPPKQPQFRPFSFEPLPRPHQTEIFAQPSQQQPSEHLPVRQRQQNEVTEPVALRSPESVWSSDYSPEQSPELSPQQFYQNKSFQSFADAYKHLRQDTPPESPVSNNSLYHELPASNHHQPQAKSPRRAIERLLSAGERDLLQNTRRTLVQLNTIDKETTDRLAASGEQVPNQKSLALRQGSYYDDTEEDEDSDNDTLTQRASSSESNSPRTPDNEDEDDNDDKDDTYSISGYSSYSQDTYFQRDMSPRQYPEDGSQDQFLFSPSKHYSFHDLPEWSDIDLGREGNRYGNGNGKGNGKPLRPLWVASEVDHVTGKAHKRNVSNTWVAAYGIELDY